MSGSLADDRQWRTKPASTWHYVTSTIASAVISDITSWHAHASRKPSLIDASGPADCCVGFIDGTFHPCARTTYWQEIIYFGYYKSHGLKNQSVIGPNGLILEFFGPHPGENADSHMYAELKLGERMQCLSCLVGGGNQYYVYGDAAYPLGPWMMRVYKGVRTVAEALLTAQMNALRVSVEHGFALIQRDWCSMNHERNLKLYKQPIGMFYYVAAIMTNVKTYMMAREHDTYGNQ